MTKPPQGRSTLQPREKPIEAKRRSRFAKSMFSTIPIVLAGSMAMSFNLTAPADLATAKKPTAEKGSPSEMTKSIREALAAAHVASSPDALAPREATTAGAPATYTVISGDTLSGIAGRYGLATASVLTLNGLGWKSMIHPGQILKLTSGVAAPTAPSPVASTDVSRYTIIAGDTVSRIAAKFGLSTAILLSANGLGWSSTIFAGGTLAIPGRTAPAIPATPAPVPIVHVTPIATSTHVIKSGQTIAHIAASYGVSIQSLLSANGLGWSSIIYSGRTLQIPGVPSSLPAASGGTALPAAPAVTAVAPSARVTVLSPEMATNARTIIQVGRSLGVGEYGLIIALATAMQESSLRNLNYGDRDSLGLFQQRPSKGWGTAAQVTDPTYAARLFFGGPQGPNTGVTRGLLDIPGWQSQPVTRAAQAVQRSGHPDAYAKWETSARSWLAQLR